MRLVEFYPLLRHTHIGLVVASGTLFALRGAAVLAGMRWPQRPGWRVASVIIDTGLLTAAVLLAIALRLNPLTTGWLAAKIVLLLVYIALGTLALKRARSFGARFVGYAASLAVFVTIFGIARAHHPLGWLRAFVG
jgi:uncharacterized membrane protein SirB2